MNDIKTSCQTFYAKINFFFQQFVFCEELHGLGARGLDLSGGLGGPDHGGSEDLSRYARASPLRWGKRTTGQVSVKLLSTLLCDDKKTSM